MISLHWTHFLYLFLYLFQALPSAAEDREAYQTRVARKAALSNWLAEAAKTKISQEVDSANFQVL